MKLPDELTWLKVKADSIVVFPTNLLPDKQIICSRERGENSLLEFQLIFTKSRGTQLAIWFTGDKPRFEKYSYFKKEPRSWRRWGTIYIPITELERIIPFLARLRAEHVYFDQLKVV